MSWSRSIVPPTVACKGPAASETRVATAERGPCTGRIEREAADIGQASQFGDQTMRRFAGMQHCVQLRLAATRSQRVFTRATELMDIQLRHESRLERSPHPNRSPSAPLASPRSPPRSPAARRRDARRVTGTGSPKLLLDEEELAGVRMTSISPAANRSMTMRQRSNCSGDQSSTALSHRGVVALRIAQLRSGQRAARRESGRTGRTVRTVSPVSRGVSASIAWRPGPVLAATRTAATSSNGRPTSPATIQPNHFAARRIRMPARCRCTARKRRHAARGSMALRHRDELGRSRCNTARRCRPRRASWLVNGAPFAVT